MAVVPGPPSPVGLEPDAYARIRARALAAVERTSDVHGALGEALEWLEAHPDEPFLLNVAGVLLHAAGGGADATPLFERALRLDPALPGAAANLAAVTSALPGADRALAERAAAVAARPSSPCRPTLTLLLLVRDEEELLGRCLAAAASAADELVVVDTGSVDASRAVAEAHGARVVDLPWPGSFAVARNAALAAARGDWVLFLDADEELRFDPGALRSLIARGWREAFAFPVESLTGDGSTSAVHPLVRLWRNRPGRRYEGRVHERLLGLPHDLPERIELVDLPILHHGYLEPIVRRRRKVARNLDLLATEPPGPYTSFNLGSEYARAARWPAAAGHLDAAWAAIGDAWPELGFGPLLAARTARARRECGRVGEAEALLATAIARLPEYTDLTFELAHCALARGAPDDAARLLRRCLAQGDAPGHLPATVGAGSHLARALLDHITRPG